MLGRCKTVHLEWAEVLNAREQPVRQVWFPLGLYVRMTQWSTSAACLHFHLNLPRLARWLLMRQDRKQDAHFHITHEGLSCMLGVRRVGVTVAASGLQRKGLIRYHHGELTVLGRAGLEALSCPCYAADRKAYAEQLG